MSVPSFRKPVFAATGCCFLLILGASLCMFHLTSATRIPPYYVGQYERPYVWQPSFAYVDVRPQSAPLGLQDERLSQSGQNKDSQEYRNPYQGREPLVQTKEQDKPQRQINKNPQSSGLSGQSDDSFRGQDQLKQSIRGMPVNPRQPPFGNVQPSQPGQNGGSSRHQGQSAQYNAQENPRQSDGSIYFSNMNYPQRGSESSQSTSGALNFAFSMLKAHVLPQQENSAICPILPQMLLASLYDVADQEAKYQLQAALQARSKELQLALYQQLLATNQSAANQLDYASTFFIGSDTKINPRFSDQAAQEGVTFQQVDFRNPNAAASVANQWVTDKTRGIIREIFSSANLDPATRLMMASVIYFKGQWKFQFTKTESATFEPTPQTNKQVKMMYQYNKFRYGEIDFKSGNGLHWVDLPYEGSSDLSMVLVLPKVRHQLQNSLQEMSLNDMKEIMNEVTERQRGTNKVHLSVPRFGVLSSTSLVPALKSLGLTAIFDRSTALTSLANEELVVRDVSQRTYIAVDEKGTTATSVASLSFVALSAAPPPPTIYFTVNEPFLVMIVDKKNGYPMFVAKVVSPEEIQN